MSDPAFEAFVNTELPLRSALLKPVDVGGYDGDPNDGGAPAKLQNSPLGTWYREVTGARWWRKLDSAPGTWEEQGAGGGNSDLGLVGRVTITWYVRNGGDDNNDGTTPGTAFATIQKALSMLVPNAEGKARQLINATGFTGSGADILYWDFPKAGSRLELDFTRDTSDAKQDYWDVPYEIIADPTHLQDVTVTGNTVDAITDLSILTVSDTLVVDELKGKRIWFGLFQQGTILSNTVNTITLATYTTGALPTGTFGIYEPSCVLDFGSAAAFSGTIFTTHCPVAFTGIRFDNTLSGSSSPLKIVPDGGVDYFTWCDFVGGWEAQGGGSSVTLFDCYAVGPGGWFPNCPFTIQGCVFENLDHSIGGSVGAGQNSIFGCLFDDCDGIAGGNFEQNTDLVCTNCHITNGKNVGIYKNHPFNGRFNANRIDNCASDGIQVTTPGQQKIRDTAGTGNGGYGCRIVGGGSVSYQHTIGVNTLTGALGEVKIGDRDPLLWTDMPAHDFDELDSRLNIVIGGPDETQPRVAYSFTFKPGSGENGPAVFDDWQDMENAKEHTRATVGGDFDCNILIDDSITSPAVMPANGANPPYNLRNCSLLGLDDNLNTRLDIADGASFVGLRRVDRSLDMVNLNTTTPADSSLANNDTIYVGFGCIISTVTGGEPLWDASVLGGGSFASMLMAPFSSINFAGGNQGPVIGGTPAGVFLLAGGDGAVQFPRTGIEGDVGSFLIVAHGSARNLPASLPGWLGTIDYQDVREPANVLPRPFGAAPYTTAQTAPVPGNWERYGVSGGAVAQPLRPVFGNDLPTPGTWLLFSEESGTAGLTLVPDPGDTINGSTDAYPVPAGGLVALMNDGISNWKVVGVFDPTTRSRVTDVKVAAYNAVAGDFVRFDPTGGAFAINLPSLATVGEGTEIEFKNVTADTTAVTLTPDGADTIDAAATLAMTGARQHVRLKAGTTDWMVA